MNDHFEELINDGLDQLTTGSTLPAGIAARARARVRRRQYQLRASLAAGAAAAAAIAVIAATSAGSAGTTPRTPAGPRSAPSVALLAKIERAVAGKARSAPVLQITTTFPAGPVPVPSDPFSTTQFNEGGVDQSSILWTRGHVLKVVMFHSKGQLDDESLTTERGLLATYTDVDYNSRSWSRGSVNFFVYKWAIPHCALQPLDPAEPRDWVPRTLAKEIKHDIACGQVNVAGRQHIDGVDAIKLAFAGGHLKVPWYDKEPAITHQVMWIDAHSYLPLRYLSTLTFAHAKTGSPRSASTQCDFKWLPATKSALAKLRLTIPRGFHQAHPKTFTVHAPAPHKSAAKHK
ncbi:MAG TPA: hypothetical protein VGM14_23230 [Streptosporangiaceae bacterium]